MEYASTITGQIIGGLAIELNQRLPGCQVVLGSIFDEPAVRVDNVWVMVDQAEFKVVVPCDPPNGAAHGIRGLECRRVLFSCSICKPDDDFEPLYEFFRRYETDFEEEEAGLIPPLRDDLSWIDAQSADNQ